MLRAPLRRCFSLFGVPFLRSPSDFDRVQKAALTACLPHIHRLSQQTPNSPPTQTLALASAREVLYRLDAVSNTLCRVLDSAEATRSLSTSEPWRESADGAFSSLAVFMYELNGHEPLYTALCRIVSNPEVMKALGREESQLATLLKAEFERDGIGQSPEVRARIGELRGTLEGLGATFTQALHAPPPLFTAPTTVGGQPLKHVLPRYCLVDQPLELDLDRGVMAAHPTLIAHCLRHTPSAPFRRAALIASHSEHAGNVATLEELRNGRTALAKLAGAESYADMAPGERLVGSSVQAVDFLTALCKAVLPRAALEAAALGQAKAALSYQDELLGGNGSEVTNVASRGDSHSSDSHAASAPVRKLFALLSNPSSGTTSLPVEPWDVAFYSGKASLSSVQRDPSLLASQYLPLSAVLQGLFGVMRRVFGVECRETPFSPGEAWVVGGDASSTTHPFLRRFELSHESEGPLGTMYLDPYSRPLKFSGAAHFVVQCGKERGEFDGGLERVLGEGGGGGSALVPSSYSSKYHLPVVALALNFAPPVSRSGSGGGIDASSTLLSPLEVETLFHEWGHAIHSLLSRTQFQHTSGTRGALDFVEIPSHLFEYWAREWGSVSQFARHYATGEPMPQALWERVRVVRGHWRGTEILQLATHALFDLALFGGEKAQARVLAGGGCLVSSGGESIGEVEGLAEEALRGVAQGGGVGAIQDTVLRGTGTTAVALELCSDGGRVGVVDSPTSFAIPSSLHSTQLLRTVSETYNLLPHLPGSTWHGGFSHVATYGGGYYSYALATVTASALWAHLFAKDPFSRASGDVLRREMLALGGAGDPKDMIRACLQGQRRLSFLPLLKECASTPLAVVALDKKA